MAQPLPGAVWFAFLIVFFDLVAFGIIIPGLPDLLTELTGKARDDVYVELIALAISYSLMQFLFGAFVGNLSDRFGRKLIILISMAALCLDFIIMANAQSVWVLFVGRIIAGIAAATFAVAFSIAADVSKPENKARALGMVGAGFGLGFIIGPLLGGLFAYIDPRLPYWIAALVAGASFFIFLSKFEETLSPSNRRPFSLKRSNPAGALLKMIDMKQFAWLFLVFFLSQIAGMVYPAIWTPYVISAFNWSPLRIGLSLALVGLMAFIVQGGLIGPIIAAIREKNAAILGLTSTGVGLICLSLISYDGLIWPLIVLTAMGGLTIPAIQAILSNLTPVDAQGELQGIFSSLLALAAVITPTASVLVFRAFDQMDGPHTFPGVAFLGAALAAGLALILLIFAVPKQSQS